MERVLKEEQDRGEEVEPLPDSCHISPPPVEPHPFELEMQPWHVIVSEALSLNVLPTRIIVYIFNIASSPSEALQEYLDKHHGIPEYLIEEARQEPDSPSPSPSSPSIDLAGDSNGSQPSSPSHDYL